MKRSFTALLISLTTAFVAPTSAKTLIALDPIFAESTPVLSKGHAGVPEDLRAFVEAELTPTIDNRGPASNHRRPAQNAPRRSIASTLGNGFEYKVYQGKRVTAFWVMKKQEEFNLVFATNGGSRQTSALPIQHYRDLSATVETLRAPASNLSRCKANYVKLTVVNEGQEARTLTACLNSEAQSAQSLKQLGNALASYVR